MIKNTIASLLLGLLMLVNTNKVFTQAALNYKPYNRIEPSTITNIENIYSQFEYLINQRCYRNHLSDQMVNLLNRRLRFRQEFS